MKASENKITPYSIHQQQHPYKRYNAAINNSQQSIAMALTNSRHQSWWRQYIQSPPFNSFAARADIYETT